MTPTTGDVTLLAELGSGGQGEVWEGSIRYAVGLERRCAIKFLRADRESDEHRQRFQNEVAIGLEVSADHPAIITTRDVIEVDGRPGIIFDLIDGASLSKIFSHARPSQDTVRHIARCALSALAHLASRGILHRDISPGNLYADRHGAVFLGDFGLARRRTQPSPGMAMGTVAYASPEVTGRHAVTFAADIYSLGAVLYELLTGCSLLEQSLAVRASHIAKLPRDLRRLLSGMLASQPTDRLTPRAAVALLRAPKRGRESLARAVQEWQQRDEPRTHRSEAVAERWRASSQRSPIELAWPKRAIGAQVWKLAAAAVAIAVIFAVVAAVSQRTPTVVTAPAVESDDVPTTPTPPTPTPTPDQVRSESEPVDRGNPVKLIVKNGPRLPARSDVVREVDGISKPAVREADKSSTPSREARESQAPQPQNLEHASYEADTIPSLPSPPNILNTPNTTEVTDGATDGLIRVMKEKAFLTAVDTPGGGHLAVLTTNDGDATRLVLQIRALGTPLPYRSEIVDRSDNCRVESYKSDRTQETLGQLTLLRASATSVCTVRFVFVFVVDSGEPGVRTTEELRL